jgi:hypothetical protein
MPTRNTFDLDHDVWVHAPDQSREGVVVIVELGELLAVQAETSPPATSVSYEIAKIAGGAILGFALNYALERIKRRREATQQISWDLRSERGLSDVRQDLQDHLRITYKETPVENLSLIHCRIANTGNRTVKNQQVRFEFPRDTRVLEATADPKLPREIGLVRDVGREEGAWECCFTIAHLDPSAEVTIDLVATGAASSPAVVGHNEAGDVQFQRRDLAKAREDREHLVPFMIFAFLLFSLPGAVRSVAFPFYPPITATVGAVIQLSLIVAILPHVTPVARVVRLLIDQFLAPRTPGTALSLFDSDVQNISIAQDSHVSMVARHKPNVSRLSTPRRSSRHDNNNRDKRDE